MYYKIKNIMYQIEFRKKVLEVKKKFNLTIDEVAKRFDISRRSVIRWSKRIEPITDRNSPQRKIDLDALKKDVEKYPDLYMYERAEKFRVSASGIEHALKKLKISHKKKV